MSYNLSEIKFTVETSQLTQAIEKLGQLKTAANAITATTAARKESIGVQREEVKLAIDQEKLEQNRLNTLKKQRAEAEANLASTQQSTAATQANTEAVSKSTSITEKQRNILSFMTQEYTRSQSSIMATAKAAGYAEEALSELGDILDAQRRLIGGDPFDKSLSSLKALSNETAILTTQMELYNQGLLLTSKQVRGLAEDKQRLIERMKLEGVSSEQQAVRLRNLNDEFLKRSALNNQMTAEIDEQTRKNKEWANSNNYVEKELEKVRFALSETNEELNRGSANSILRFENALKRSGKTVEEQTKLLAEYRTAQMKLQKAGGDRAVDYITRAVGPQITDIFVGLSTGQSPLTVMLQQGGQLRDQFAMMKVDSKDMAEVMRNSMKSMVVSVKDTAFAMGSLLGSAVKDTGIGVTNFLVKGFQEATIASRAYRIEMLQGKQAAEEFKTLSKLTGNMLGEVSMSLKIAAGVAGAFIGTAVVALTTYAVSLYKTNKAENELSRSLLLTGASLGLNISQASALISEQGKLGVSMTDTTRVLTAMAKEGGFTQEQFQLINKAAIELERVGGPKIEDTVKRFAKFKDEPVKALRELQVQTGLVDEETVKSIKAHQDRGEAVKAATLADKEAARVLEELKKDYEKNAGWWTNLGLMISEAFKPVTNVLNELTRIKGPTDKLKAAQEILKDMQGNQGFLGYNEKQLNSQKELVKSLEEQVRVEQVEGQWKKTNQERASAQVKIETDLAALANSRNEQLAKTLSLTDYIAKRRESIGADKKKFVTPEQFKQYDELYKKEWETHNKSTELKDNTIAKLKETYNAESSLQKTLLQNQLANLKSAREAEFITEEEYRRRSTDLFNASMKTQLDDLNEFSTKTESAYARQLANKPKDLANLTNAQKAFRAEVAASNEELQSNAFKFYITSIQDASRGIVKTTKDIEDLQSAEARLSAERKDSMDLQVQSLTLNSDEIAGLKAYNAEKARITELIVKQEKAVADARKQNSGAQAAVDAAGNGPTDLVTFIKLVQTAAGVQGALGNAEQALAALKKQLADNPEMAKFTAMFENTISRTNELKQAIDDLDVGKRFAAGFDDASASVGMLVGNMNKLIQKQKDYDLELEKAKDDPAQQATIRAKQQRQDISYYAEMAGVSKKYFKEKTAGYKVLSGVEKAFRAAELAGVIMNATTAIMKYADMAGAAVISAGTQIAALFGVGEALSVNAVLTQGSGDPWSAPVRMAAMAATVAALGFAVGGSFGSSGSVAPSNEGTGTVLGDKGAKSQSLPNALSRLNDIDTMQLKYSAGMLTALRSIDNNTKVLGAALAQSGAIDISKSGEGIATGLADSWGTKISNQAYDWLDGFLGTGDFFSNTLGKLDTKLFGSSTKIQGQGIISGDQNLGKILSEGFDAQYYSDIVTKKKFLGATRKTIRSTNIVDQGTEDLDRKLTMIFVNMAEALKAASGPLGLAMQDVENKINSATVSIGKVDLSGGNIEEKLQAVFSKAGDLLAEQVIPGFEEFNRLDEGYLETVIRVATGVEYATNALDMLGISAINFKDIQAKQGDVDAELIRDSILAKEGLNGISDIIKSFGGDAAGMVEAYQSLASIRESLAGIGLTGDLVGVSLIKGGKGLDELKSSISAFTGLLPEAEQLSLATESLRAKFKLLGIDSMPTTAEAFVSLVKGVDTTTESGKVLLGKLLGLSDAFQTVADEADRIKSERLGLEEELLKLQTTEAEQRKKSLESLDPSNRALQEQIWLLQDQKKATEELTKALESAGKSIQDEINRLRGVTAGSGSGTLQAQFAIKTASARSGNLDSLKSLPDLSKAIETAVMGTASTEFEVAKTKAWLAASLSETMQMLGMSTDSSGNVTVGSSLTGTTSGSSASGSTLIVDKTNQELLTELKTLNAKVADLEAAAVATALTNSKMHKILDRVAADGNNFSVVVNTETAPVQVHTV